MKTRTLIALSVMTTTTLIAHAGGVTSWLNANNGDWDFGPNWSTGSVPGLSDSVLLGHASPYTVTIPASQAMASLSITNPGVLLNTANASTTTIAGDFFNEGSVSVNYTSNISATTLRFDANTMLSGSGSILLNAPTARARLQTGDGFTFTQGSGHTIHGMGQIEGAMINNGTISSDSGSSMTLLTNDKANNNIIESINGSNLLVSGITITQGLAGIMRADGPGSRVTVINSTLNGGTMSSLNDGLMSIATSSTINGVSINGVFDVQNAVTLSVLSSLENNGTITINPTGNISATQIVFNDSMTVGGDGTFVLASADSRARIQTGVGRTVTMNPMLTIRGQGRIEASMINNGLINSDTGEIRMTTNGKTNNGTMEATAGAVMEFSGITTTQGPAGLIQADGVGSQIELRNASIIGGTLRASNGADVSVDTSSTLDSVNISGTLNVQNAVTLSVENGLSINGTVTVNPTSNVSTTQIRFKDSMTLGGTGEIVLAAPSSRSRIQTDAEVVLTMPSTQTVRGFGQIEAELVNNGLIRADSGEIRLSSNPKTNNATIEAINASVVEINAITINQSSGGTISANDAGSQIELIGSTINGGAISSMPDADVSIDISSTLNGVALSGHTYVQNGQKLAIGTSLTNNGVIEINPTGNISSTELMFNDSMTVLGTGSVKLSSSDGRARIQTAAEKTVTMSSTQKIHGQGRIEASMVNNGTIDSDVPGSEIRLLSNPKTNNGVIQANNETTVEFNGITITQGAPGQITADGEGSEIELLGATISGGTLATTGGADVSVDSYSILDGVDFSGLLNIPNASSMGITAGTLNNGTIVVNETANISPTHLQWNEETTLSGTGTIRLNAPGARSRLIAAGKVSQGGIGAQQRLEGIGSIEIDFINNGTIAPGLSIGTMAATKPILFTDTANLEAEVDASSGDALKSTSTVELHGTLDVLFINDFAPTGFWAYTIIEGSEITGEFDTINIAPPPGDFVTRVVNTGTKYIIGHTCKADLTLDGQLDFFDVSDFLDKFAAKDPEVDFTQDGQFDFFDVSDFLDAFGAGC
tara:strand:+ start:183340 stop:186492 length:3153 start_codon:yes stop_codon:yes gene_type:complete